MNDWTRWCVIRYVREAAQYERRKESCEQRAEKVRADMEHVLAVRYDRDGSAAGWTDRMPEALDELAAIADELEAAIVGYERDYQRALDIFETNEDTRMVWEHWGLRMRWADVAHRHCYNRDYVRQIAARGIETIWHLMPEEYRRSPYPAEEWRGPYCVK